MNQKPPTRQCVHCGAPAEELRYHSRYLTRDGVRRVFRCRHCRRTFCDRFGTAFYDLKTEEAKVQRAVHQVMEGLGYEAVARSEEVPPRSVHRWIGRVSAQAVSADREIIREVAAETIEMDELYSFAGTKQVVPQSATDETGKHWVHCSMARESRLLLDVRVAPRTLETAKTLTRNSAARLARGCWPLWWTDGWESYVEALLSIFHLVLHVVRRRRRGRPRHPQTLAHPALRYAQVVKQRVGRRLVSALPIYSRNCA